MNAAKTKISIYSLLLTLQFVIVLLMIFGLIWGVWNNGIYFDEVNTITIISLVAFIVLCVGGIASTRLYFVFLIIQIIALPSAIDNLIPGVYFGHQDELDSSIFPIFTHIDLFLLLGIAKGLLLKKKPMPSSNNIFLGSVLILFISSLVNIVYSENTQDFLLVVAGFFHLRYLFEFYVLFSLFNCGKYSKQITTGLIISVLFLFAESMIFTRLNDIERLTSGTLGNNSFGNLVSCITVYFIFVYQITRSFFYKILLLISIGVGVAIVLLTETRMALVAGFVLYFIGNYYNGRMSIAGFISIVLGILVIGLVVALSGILHDEKSNRFDIGKVASKIHLSFPWDEGKSIQIEPSPETLSLITRLRLYETSLNMIEASPFFGIGSMRWNFHKSEYGFDEHILLDSHNGYLAITSQFGLFAILFIYLVYLWPLNILKNKVFVRDNNYYLALIPVGIAVCDLTNAGIYKHQIFALMSLIVILLIQKNRTKPNLNLNNEYRNY